MLTYTNPPAGCYITHTCPEWISVKTVMPDEKREYVLIWNGYVHIALFDKGSFWDTNTTYECTCCYEMYHDVTHWMPLPEAPEKDYAIGI